MSFPEWGNSYNALYVPLTNDWQCSLVPVRDVQDVDRGWTLSYEERQEARREREKQIEQDRRDFARLFRVSIGRRDARTCRDFAAYAAFIGEHLRISGWDTPVDGESVTRILRDAVRDGWLVPAIDRAWRGGRQVIRFYAPQSWPKRAPEPKPTVYGVRNGEFVPLDDNGYFIDHTPYVPVVASLKNATRSSSGTDWPHAVEEVMGALPGGRTLGMADSLTHGASTPGESMSFGDAHPFEYHPDPISGGVFDLAANDRGGIYACDILSAECKGSVLREFPSQYLNSTLNEIQGDAQSGMKDARKALKLLNDNRFKK